MLTFKDFFIMEKTFPYSVVILKKVYDVFNAKYFNGTLPDIPVSMNRRTRSFARALAMRYTEGRMVTFKPTGIEFSNLFNLTEEQMHGMMLHEMIHVWQYLTNNVDGSNAGHGKKFNTKLKELQLKAPFKIPKSEDIDEIEYGDKLSNTTYHVLLMTLNGGKDAFTRLSKGFAEGSEMDATMKKIISRGMFKTIVYGTTKEPSLSKVKEKRSFKTLEAYGFDQINEKGFRESFVELKKWSRS